ncbi:efflux RND transporter periplasmic adaptor subunit [Paracoccus aminophilus]|uniref:NolF secretion protein n=1 Tax=Paracoccus aminophilus JCM 7686 TaxID=1367847 RepID=S5XYR5_PARAH|nr:efflux RND transporter periplasmic adaptor subunit [Paracoccus aminophilus]AGT08570.1 nolF secretion protein [Paracoccus aminophilus JCM 7686]
MAARRSKRLWIAGLALGVAALAGAYSLSRGPEGDEGAGLVAAVSNPASAAEPVGFRKELSPADVTLILPQTLTEKIAVSGELRPVNRTIIKAKVTGTIRTVTVKTGQSVKAGEVLVTFDTEDLESELRRAESNLKASQAQLVLAGQTLAKTEELQRRNAATLSALEKSQSDEVAARANVASLEAQVETARTALSHGELTSPIDGVVASRAVEQGETVGNGADLLSVVDDSVFEAQVLVATRDVARLSVGQQAELSIDGLGDQRLTALIDRISPVANEGTRFVPVYLHLDAGGLRLWGGMFASGTITLRAAEGVIAVPEKALREDEQGHYVLVLADGELKRRPVETGESWQNGRLTAITSGLAAGETVLTAPIRGLVAGTPAVVTGAKTDARSGVK